MYFIATEAIAANDLICASGPVTGLLPKMEKVDSSAVGKGLIWVAKNAVPIGARGIAVPWRLIKNVNTSALGAGQILYVDWATPGAYAKWGTGPASLFAVNIGQVLVSHATEGVVLLAPQASAKVPNVGPVYSVEAPPTVTNSAPAIPTTEPVVLVNSSGGATTLTLADGQNGQILHLAMTVAGNDATLGNTYLNGTSLVLNAVGEGATLVFDSTTGKWNCVGTTGTYTA